jgi:hypothetical protein
MFDNKKLNNETIEIERFIQIFDMAKHIFFKIFSKFFHKAIN